MTLLVAFISCETSGVALIVAFAQTFGAERGFLGMALYLI